MSIDERSASLAFSPSEIAALQAVLQLAVERHYEDFYLPEQHCMHLRLERRICAFALRASRESGDVALVNAWLRIHRAGMVSHV